MVTFIHQIKHFADQLMDNEKLRLKHFSIAAVIFFSGYGSLYSINKNSTGTLENELMALSVLAITLVAFGWAIFIHVLTIISRTLR